MPPILGAAGGIGRRPSAAGAATAGGAASRTVSCTGDRVRAMRERLCSKVGCAREAVSTLTYDYGDQMVVVGPLAGERDPHAHDLCAIHTDRLSVPKGWVVVRHETLRV